MNIDGATAAIYAELGVAPPLARGRFGLSRSVGVIAQVSEQTRQVGRGAGPTPPSFRWSYADPNPIGDEARRGAARSVDGRRFVRAPTWRVHKDGWGSARLGSAQPRSN